MKNYLSRFNSFAVSANHHEVAINSAQTLNVLLLCALGNIPQLIQRREDNRNQATGKEEPDTIYEFGATSEMPLDFEMAQAQHLAFLFSYALGISVPSAWGTGYKHLITPTSSMSLESFTAAHKAGDTIMKRRFYSMFVDTLKVTLAKDQWVKASAGLKGTGKYDSNMTKETVNAAYNATSLTLAANAVQGSTAALRLDNVHSIRVEVPTTGEWKEVTFTVVSDATPAVITIDAPGGVGTLCDYEILYVAAEAAWCTFPARVTEPPLRISDLLFKIGGTWDGSAFQGGRTLACEIESIEYNLNNQLAIEFCPGSGVSGDYANNATRMGRMQTLTLTRQARDYILQQRLEDNEYLGIYLKAQGAEFESGKKYYIEMVFPRCGILKAPVSMNGNIIAEAGDIEILQDDTYGSIRVEVANMQSEYCGDA